jgi:hypothetical protein
MYFQIKNTLKNNHYHTPKQPSSIYYLSRKNIIFFLLNYIHIFAKVHYYA